jgi:hypothetical protein
MTLRLPLTVTELVGLDAAAAAVVGAAGLAAVVG